MRRYLEASPPRRQAIRERITGILRARPEVIGAFLFGSFVQERPFRDVDLGVLVDPGRVPEAAAPGFASALASELEWETRVPVDLTVLNYASIGLRYHASRGEVIVCRDPERCNQFREQAWREYLDFEPFLRTSLRDLLPSERSRPGTPVDPAAPAVRGNRPEGGARSKS